MQKIVTFLIGSAFTLATHVSFAQKTVNAAVLEYDVATLDGSDSSFNSKSHQKYYYAPDQLRIDSWYDDGSVETYFNGKSNTVTSLQSGGGEAIYNVYPIKNWKLKSPYVIAKLEPLSEEKTIQNHPCKAAKIYYKDNTSEKIFYTTDLAPLTEKNTTTKQDIPGFVLAREIFNKDKELIQKVTLKSFVQTVSQPNTFIPETKGYTKQDLFE